MNATKEKYYRTLFAIAAVYDLALGIAFTFCPGQTFDLLGIRAKLPAFGGYLTLIGAFVLVLGISYAVIAGGNLRRNLNLIAIGALYKLAYAATAFYYWAQGGLPHVVFGSVFGVADIVFFILIAECFVCLKQDKNPPQLR
jgi:hypothetical protein